MQNQASLQETKQHGAVRFPFNLYPCTIPGDFQQVALHWHESMELVFVKQGMGLVQVGAVTYPAYRGDIFIFAPGTLHALRQAEGQRMEYENIIFEPELLGGAEDLCAEKYLLPLQSGRLSLPVRLTPNDLCYLQAAACLRELEDANRAKRPGYELLVKGALLRFLALLIAQGRQCLSTETADTQRLKAVLQCPREKDRLCGQRVCPWWSVRSDGEKSHRTGQAGRSTLRCRSIKNERTVDFDSSVHPCVPNPFCTRL